MEEKGNSSQQSSPALVPSGVLLEAEVFWFTPCVGGDCFPGAKFSKQEHQMPVAFSDL